MGSAISYLASSQISRGMLPGGSAEGGKGHDQLDRYLSLGATDACTHPSAAAVPERRGQ